MTKLLVVVIAASMLIAAAAWAYREQSRLIGALPVPMRDTIRGLRHGFRVTRDVRIPMPDDVTLAANVYRPTSAPPPYPTVLVRLPYDKNQYGEAVATGEFFARHGYAVVTQDSRGKFNSEGIFTPSRRDDSDGSATIDWIATQPWSNGKVGTYGCSSLGESQVMLARTRNPHHAAMISQGSGGAIGTAGNRYTFFGQFEGGIWNLASGFGWFFDNGSKERGHPRPPPVDHGAVLNELPTIDLVRRYRKDPTDYEAFISTPFSDPFWRELGYISDEDRFATPALMVNSWQDQTVADTFALAEVMRRNADSEELRENLHVIVGPGNHCALHEAFDVGVGDFRVGEQARKPYFEWYLAWFDHWLRDRSSPLPDLPRYYVYVMAEDRWIKAESWPPAGTRVEPWYLASERAANGVSGDGRLGRTTPQGEGADDYVYDPARPVPTLGGPICCTGKLNTRSGIVDQRAVEERGDVLVYTSAALEDGLRIVGPLQARLFVESSALDTDLMVKLADVAPDGVSYNVQEGALRLRYRDGYTQPARLVPGQVYDVTVDMRAIAHYFKPGHRVRIQITSSNFPRLERNLNTGGRNYDETEAVVAHNRIWHGSQYPSAILLPVLDRVD